MIFQPLEQSNIKRVYDVASYCSLSYDHTLEMDDFVVIDPPESFDSAIPLLSKGNESSNSCQNILSVTNTENILMVKYREKVRSALPFRTT